MTLDALTIMLDILGICTVCFAVFKLIKQHRDET